MEIKFMKHYVQRGAVKARVFYSESHHIDGRGGVTLDAKDFLDGPNLEKVMGDLYRNESDGREDYFEKGRVRILPDSPYYAAALARCK